MARTKIKRRTYNLGTPQHTENSPRESESLPFDVTPQEATANQPQDCLTAQAKTSEMSPAPAALIETSQVSEALEQEDLVKSVPQNSPITERQEVPSVNVEETVTGKEETTIASNPQEDILDKDDDSLELKSPILGCRKRPTSASQIRAKVNDNVTKSPILGCRKRPTSASQIRAKVTHNKSPILGCRKRPTSASQIRGKVNDNVTDWAITGNNNAYDEAEYNSYVGNVDVNDSLTISRDSPLNLAWDSSIKENCRQSNFRPRTPDNLLVPVDDIFSPTTQKQIRTTIRALFPNGPPPPPPVRPMRRPKKGDEPYIVNCNKRPRVPSPKSLNVFTGDQYGITSNSNCDPDEEEENYTPEKRAKRGTYGSTSKSAFNRQTNEITERLKLYEKIDRLVGRSPKEPIGYMTKRAFSPLPSTSTDNETIMKNDKHFSESLNCDFDIDEDDELPEVIWNTNNYKKGEDQKGLPSPLVSKVIKEEKNDYTDSVQIETNEDMNNNNNEVIAVEDDFCEIQFDKLLPREKLLDYSDVEPKKESEDAVHKKVKIDDYFPAQPKNQLFAPSRNCSITSTDVICVDDYSTNVLNPITSAQSVNSSILRSSNKNATATETRQSDLVIEVPDVLEPINMSRHARNNPSWYEEVQFVSEERIERPTSSNTENTFDIQVVSGPSRNRTPEIIDRLQQILSSCFTEQYSKRRTKSKIKQAKAKENLRLSKNETASVTDENTSPIHIENASFNNENAAPSVNQVTPDTNSVTPSGDSSPSKRLGECPICLDGLQRGSIASTNCGHVFCLDCIKQSLITSGKRCPTCRKQLKGVGYHQVFL